MKKADLDEPEAFLRLQKLSRDQNQKMVEVARMILGPTRHSGRSTERCIKN